MQYSRPLDALRSLAVMLVLFQHLASPYGDIISAGYAGVTLFFVLSGFLITSRLLDSESGFFSSYFRFLCRRTLRIFPAYYLLIAILFVSGYNYVQDYLLYCITYTYNYAMVFFHIPKNAITHFWSLAVEEQFYLFWPLPLLLLKKRKSLLLAFVVSAILFSYCQFYFKIIPSLAPYTWVGLLSQLHSLAIGGAGAVLFNRNAPKGNWFQSATVEGYLIPALLFFLVIDTPFRFLACPLLFLFLVLKSYHQGITNMIYNKWLHHPVLVFTGRISYGIYLYHLPVYYFMNQVLYPHGKGNLSAHYRVLLDWPLCTVLSIILASASYYLMEKPLLRWKDRIFPVSELSAES